MTFTATITSSSSGTPTGTVTFLDGTATLGTGMLNGSGVANLNNVHSHGRHALDHLQKYAGSANFASSTSAAMMETITLATTTARVGQLSGFGIEWQCR